MAAIATRTITIEQYLNGPVPDPDVEFIDGELRERPVVMSIHGRLQIIIGAWFERHAEQWGVLSAVEVRTRVTVNRVRLPDIVVDAAGAWPETLTKPPLIVVETLSPSETFSDLLEKICDYRDMGVLNIWIINPKTRQGWVAAAAGLMETSRFTVEGTGIYLDLADVFARYDRFR